MANQNLFEKYGIKEVADVTFYRIERRNETYESQRKITVSSILKGALETKIVYPMTGGVGDEEGFEAYVFSDADIMEGSNYECDDTITVTETFVFDYISNTNAPLEKDAVTYENLTSNAVDSKYEIKQRTIVNTDLGKVLTEEDLKDYEYSESTKGGFVVITTPELVEGAEAESLLDDDKYLSSYKIVFKTTYSHKVDSDTLPDASKMPGTHEYTYEEQILMLFAKNQNLVDKTGVRYHFNNGNTIFENVVFNDNFAVAPNSTEKVVVCGLSGRFTPASYDLNEVRETISSLTQTYTAKAYDVTYSDYAELIVE